MTTGFRREGDKYIQLAMPPKGTNWRKHPPKPTGKVYDTLSEAMEDNQ